MLHSRLESPPVPAAAAIIGMVCICELDSFIGSAPYVEVSVDPLNGTFLPWNTSYS